MADADLSNPILNSPFDPPERHFELGERGPTGEIKEGRRRSESFIPVPRPTKGSGKQQALDFDVTGERLEQNSLINDVRVEVERWRVNNWNGVTPYTRKLLVHWLRVLIARTPFSSASARPPRPQSSSPRSPVATAPPTTGADSSPSNTEHNAGLPRVGLKMATGTGKTVVMAMLIAWQTINKAMAPSDARFAKRFLIVTPGITIRDRLGVLHPEREDSYYRERDLVPPDLWHALLKAEIGIVNYHTFLPRDAKEIQGVAANTRKLLRGGKAGGSMPSGRHRPTSRRESFATSRRWKGGDRRPQRRGSPLLPGQALEHPDESADKEDKDRNREARVWFRGLEESAEGRPIKAVYDLSATPYYLKGSGYNEGFIFPWVV